MSEHQYWRERDGAWSDPIVDPGASGAIGVLRSGHCEIVTAAAETRTLANPAFLGQVIALTLRTDSGDCTMTIANGYNAAGTTSLVLNDAGDMVHLVGIRVGTNLRWRLLAADPDVPRSISGDLTLEDGADLVAGTTTGTKIGTAVGQKLSLWNATPIVQPAHADQGDQGAMSFSAGSIDTGTDMTAAEAAAIVSDLAALDKLLTAMRTAMVNAGTMKGAA